MAELTLPLTDQWGDIREGVAQICTRFDNAYWMGLEAASDYPHEFVDALTGAGYLGALIPEEYGGAGLPIAAGHAQMYTMGTVLRHGSDEQKRTYLPGIASGALRLQAFGVTEPTTGSDTTQLKTRATREGNQYVVNGQKVWTSRALQSDLMVLLARTTPADQVRRRSDGISVFLVDLREAVGNGIEIRKLDAAINHNTTEIFIDNLKLPPESLIGEEGKGFKYILDGMNAERILIAHESLGDGKYFIRRATDYAKERVVFGHPIGRNQGIQFPIARAYAQSEAAALMVKRAASLYEAATPCGPEANMAKMLASEASWFAADTCLQTHGGFGFAEDYDVERKFRETRLYQVAPISTNLILAYIAEHVLGLPRSY
jgi:acyl-CoA dehydrogenase